ncbi:MBL fold metallo-hydrolase [Streptomyces sp. NPDC059474]|uniref:MBL fold metallo-hydrolase n=1 Tax=Streptomyces sp. NPDC059474 TaxID=3346846 RepID=UPI00368CB135
MSFGELIEVADGAWAWIQPDGTWWLNNAGLIATPEGDVLIDTCGNEERTAALLDAVSDARPGSRLRWAMNTHAHGDHVFGNSLLPPDIALIGHEGMRHDLERDTLLESCPPLWTPLPVWGNVTKRLPNVIVHERLDIVAGDVRVQLLAPGYPAHTGGDLVAWVPQSSVLFAGDLVFAGLTPLLLMGSVSGARRALEWIEGFGAQVIVPGHGPVLTGREIAVELDSHRRYYDFVESVGRAALAAGRTPLETAESVDLGEFADWPDVERIVMNLHRWMADAEGREVDHAQAWTDALAFNGGPMHTSI